MYESYVKFLSWPSEYDTGGTGMRSRQLHEEWIQRLTCTVIRRDGTQPIETKALETVQAAAKHLSEE